MKRALFALAVLCSSVVADEATTLFQQGNRYYEAGQYAEAVQAYEKILASGKENWQVHYNLGNAYFKQRQIGKAILYYEKARALNADNEDILFNLQLANLSIIDRIPAPTRSLVVVWVDAALHVLSIRSAAMLAAALWVLLLTVLVVMVLTPGGMLRRISRQLVWPCFILWLAAAIVWGWQMYEKSKYRYGIVLVPRVVVTSAPSEDATEVFTLHEGVRVQLEATSAEHQRIRLADGKVGWMPQTALGRI